MKDHCEGIGFLFLSLTMIKKDMLLGKMILLLRLDFNSLST